MEAGFKVLPCYQQTFGELTGQMAECCELAEPKFEHGKRDSYDCRKKAYNAMVPVAQAYGNCLAAGNADCQKKTWGQYGVIYRDWAKCRGEKLELYLRERQAFNPSVARCGMECDGDFFAKVMSCLQQFPEDNFNGILNCWLAEWPALTECRYQCAKGNDLLPAKESRAVYNCRSKVILAAQKCFYDERGGMVGTYADCMKTARDEMKSCCEQIEQQYGGRQYSPATDFATGAVDRFSEVLLYLALPVVYPPYLDFMGAAWLKEREPEIYNGQELFRGPWGCFNWTWIFMGSSPKWEDKDNSAS
ncbi:MAG: hypothetical protein LBK76_09960 [Verrucomicrobiales bacterium]|nr:hypothetical protein [Verrucomicrobiales bacterium]